LKPITFSTNLKKTLQPTTTLAFSSKPHFGNHCSVSVLPYADRLDKNGVYRFLITVAFEVGRSA
jgi:hypothetical protein